MRPISVVIVNYNAGALLADCVRSVLSSTVPVEIIVCDNRSRDQSIPELRRCFPGEQRLCIVENPDNLGFAKANNVALPLTTGDFVLFLNPDCLVQPDTLARMVEVMEKHPRVGMVGCLIRNPDGSEQAGCRRSIPTPWRTFVRLAKLSILEKYHPGFHSYVHTGLPMPDDPIEVEAISGAFMFTRRSAIDLVGPMDEGYFMHCEDLDWCMRFREAGMAILFVPDAEILHIGGVCSATRPVWVEYYKHKGMVRFYRKFFRQRYPALLMWLVMIGVGVRFLLRAGAHFLRGGRHPHREDAAIMLPISSPPIPPSPEDTTPRNGRQILVTGATSLIGDFLLPALVRSGFDVHAVSRNPPHSPASPWLHWHTRDIAKQQLESCCGADSIIHLAPLWTLPPLVPQLALGGVRRIIAFSSTSLFTKSKSGYEQERVMAQRLQTAETELAELCRLHGIDWTIFRPTLVYNLGRDKNVTTISRFINRFGFFPLVGAGNGLRQPVHAEDLAMACLKALDHAGTFGKAYNLSGGEQLTYRQMVEKIFQASGKKPIIGSIPLPMLRLFLRALSLLSVYRHFTPEMANRINTDLVFSHQDAREDFGFTPRAFRLLSAEFAENLFSKHFLDSLY